VNNTIYLSAIATVLLAVVLIQSCKLPEVVPAPIAGFTLVECATLQNDSCSLELTNTSLYGEGYLWDFGDGTTSTAFEPQDKYVLADCIHDVTLTVLNESGSDEYSEFAITAVDVSEISPTSLFETSNNCVAPCSEGIQFVNLSQCANSFEWSFEAVGGGTQTSTVENPLWAWTQPGDYLVVLEAFYKDFTLGIDVSDVYSETIHVYDPDDAVITEAAFSSPHVCQSFMGNACSFQFTNDSDAATDYLWDFDNGQTSTEENPVIEFAGDPNVQVDYDITLIAYGVFNNDTLVSKIHVIPNDITAAVFHPSVSQCEAPCVVEIEHYSINAVAWEWDFGNGEMSNVQFPGPVTYNAPGVYTIVLTATGPDLQESVDTEQLIITDPVVDWSCGDPWYDTRDGNFYNTVDINGSCFFAENLNFEAGDQDYVGTGAENCQEGFRYYDWDVAQSSCPPGWKIPTEAELLVIFGGNFLMPNPTPVDLEITGTSGFNAETAGLWEGTQCGDGTISMLFWAMDDAALPKFWAFDAGAAGFWIQYETELTDPWAAETQMLNIRCLKE
jgi:uncharacterized protein (TIGR02145 family)